VTTDALFKHIEFLQDGKPWGRFLDAGTGNASLRWVTGLNTMSWTAITADPQRALRIENEFSDRRREGDRVLSGNWSDPLLLEGEAFDVVLADYLIGSMDRFSPYFQYRFLRRLRPHVGTRLYLVGLEPYHEKPGYAGGRLVMEIANLRDACILHAGHRCHREYPADWTIGQLESSGFAVEEEKRFPIIYGSKFINEQLDVCRRKLEFIENQELVSGLRSRIDKLRQTALSFYDVHRGIRFGYDYVISARPV
jgi:hypothetical protein